MTKPPEPGEIVGETDELDDGDEEEDKEEDEIVE